MLDLDEVESLTSARKAAMNGSEPSDAIRVVNAVITQLDNLKRFHNCLVLTTSNITGALGTLYHERLLVPRLIVEVDMAFVDRADIKEYIGAPEFITRYQVTTSMYVFTSTG